MKNLIVAFSFGILLFSCSKSGNISDNLKIKKDSVIQNEFVIDSLKIGDSVSVNKNLSAIFKKQILIFPLVKDKVLLDSIYSSASLDSKSYDANSLKSELNQKMQNYFSETKENSKEWSPDFKQTWDENSAMKMVSHNENLLTIKYFGNGFSGGAHGYYFENYKTFDLKDKKVISQNDIFKNPEDKFWNEVLMKNFTNKDQKEMLLVEKIPLNNNFYFDNQQITFVYNQYEITAYAAGAVSISLKFSDIKDKLKPEFLEKYKIK